MPAVEIDRGVRAGPAEPVYVVNGQQGGSTSDATAANQTTEINRLEAIRDRLPSSGVATQATLADVLTALNNALTSLSNILTRLNAMTDPGDTQPVSGSVAIAGTPNVNISGTPSVNVANSPTVGISGNPAIVGNAASGAADSGNPVKTGGVYNTTPPTLTNGQRGDTQLTSRGEIVVSQQDVVNSAANITAVDAASTTNTGQDNQSIITGNPTANSAVSAACTGDSTFAIQVSGTWVGTLQFERSLDNGTTWTPIGAFSAGTNVTNSAITANGAFHGNASSATNIRVRATAFSSGTAVIRILVGAGTGTITIGNAVRGDIPVGTAAITGSTSPAYSIGDNLGGVVTLSNFFRKVQAGAILNNVVWAFPQSGKTLRVHIFRTPPVNTPTDNNALPNLGSGQNRIMWTATLTELGSFGDRTLYGANLGGLMIRNSADTSLYIVPETQSALTLTSTDAGAIQIGYAHE